MSNQNHDTDVIMSYFLGYINNINREHTKIVEDLLQDNNERGLQIEYLKDRINELVQICENQKDVCGAAKDLLDKVLTQNDLETDDFITEIENLKDVIEEKDIEIAQLEELIEEKDIEIAQLEGLYEAEKYRLNTVLKF